MMISYGHQVTPEGDYYVSLADQALSYLARAGIFGTYLVDYISICTLYVLCLSFDSQTNVPTYSVKYVPAWLPGATFKRQAIEWRKRVREMLNQPFKSVQERMVSIVTVSKDMITSSLRYRPKALLYLVLPQQSWNGLGEPKPTHVRKSLSRTWPQLHMLVCSMTMCSAEFITHVETQVVPIRYGSCNFS